MVRTATVSGVESIGPPSDPEEWTDEQWLTWLKATDEDANAGLDADIARGLAHVAKSAPGQVIAQAMLGLAQAMYGRQDDDLIVVAEGNGETLDDEPFEVRLDPDHPERSSVVFKADPTREL